MIIPCFHAGDTLESTLCSVIVGNEGNLGPLGMLEFDGSDGTVRTSTASLRCRRLSAEFRYANAPGLSEDEREARLEVEPRSTKCTATTAFRIVDGLDHGDVTLKTRRRDRAGKAAQDATLGLILDALSVTDDGFTGFVEEWDRATAGLQAQLDADQRRHASDGNPFTLTDDEKHAHHNFVLNLRDSHGVAVTDFVLELYNRSEFDRYGSIPRDSMTRTLNRKVIDDVHEFRLDGSRRCFHLDLFELQELCEQRPDAKLSISVSANPSLNSARSGGSPNRAGYYSFERDDIGSIDLPLAKQLSRSPWFAPHATTLAEFTIERQQLSELFEISEL